MTLYEGSLERTAHLQIEFYTVIKGKKRREIVHLGIRLNDTIDTISQYLRCIMTLPE